MVIMFLFEPNVDHTMAISNIHRPMSNRRHCVRRLFIALFAVLGTPLAAHADVLYSTIQGATATGSVQPAHSSSLNLTGDVNNAGPYGFGDDYTSAYAGQTGAAINASNGNAYPNLISTDTYVQLSSISFYGDVEPVAGLSTITFHGQTIYSLGANLFFYFYDKSGILDRQSGDLSSPTATGTNATPSSVQGPGLHTITFSSTVYIPASGFLILNPYLAGSNNGSVSTPEGTVAPSLTGYFGNAPTVGTGTAGTFATLSVDQSGNNVLTSNATFSNLPNPTPQNPDGDDDDYTYTPSPSNATSSGYMQLELDGTGLGGVVPEPTSIALVGLGIFGFLGIRRPRVVSPSVDKVF